MVFVVVCCLCVLVSGCVRLLIGDALLLVV